MHKFKILALAVVSLFFFWSCTKIDTTRIGGGLIPPVDNINTFDTIISVVANNVDSASKDCFIIGATDERPLGFISNDPLFGKTAATIYTELKPFSFPFTWPATAATRTLDSVVLVLSFKGSYGDTTIPQKVNVFEILGSFKADTSSCTFHDFAPPLLGSAVFTPQRLRDSVKGFRENSANQLRIKLSSSFGQMFLSQDSAGGKLRSDSAFKQFFKGFAIIPDTFFTGNAISFFNLADTNTKLAFYYKHPKPAGGGDTTVVSNFRLTPLAASASYVTRSRANSEITQHLSQPAVGDDVIYIQASPGTFANIKIPDLSLISNRIIHRAELIMEQVYSGVSPNNFFTTPNFLFVDIKDTAFSGTYRPIPCDFNALTGTPDLASFGGFRTTVKDFAGNSIARYTFNISRYVQKIVTNKRPSAVLRLRAPSDIYVPNSYVDECGQPVPPMFYPLNQPVAGRVKLGGGKNPNYRMRVRIIYSRI